MESRRKEERYASTLLACIALRVFFGILIVLLFINYLNLSLPVIGYGKRWRRIFFKLYYKGKEEKKIVLLFR